MPLKNYGVLKGKIDYTLPAGIYDATPHYHAWISTGHENFEIKVNTKSLDRPSEMLYFVSERFKSENISLLPELAEGFTSIHKGNRDLALDYIRGGLFEPTRMICLPSVKKGLNNDLNEKLDHYMQEAKRKGGVIYVYGDQYSIFGNSGGSRYGDNEAFPTQGLHNIHMNQGNHPRWRRDDGIWQDGGILIHFESEQRWVGIFLAFQSQSWCTDYSGHTRRSTGVCSHMNARMRIR